MNPSYAGVQLTFLCCRISWPGCLLLGFVCACCCMSPFVDYMGMVLAMNTESFTTFDFTVTVVATLCFNNNNLASAFVKLLKIFALSAVNECGYSLLSQ